MAAGPEQPIGVFDSGVGGLTVVRALLAQLPHEHLVYLGDTARVPYGTRSAHTVVRYSLGAARFLLGQGVKMVVVACNTASAAALPALTEELPVGVLGAVGPGAQAAARATRSGVVGVIGTLGTIRSGAYERALQDAAPGVRVAAVACPLLVPLIEEGWIGEDDEVTAQVARRYLLPLREQAPELDTLVLGCTHYPLILPLLHRVAAQLWPHPVQLVDSASAMAEAAQAALAEQGLLRGPPDDPLPNDGRRGVDRLRFFVTDEARVAEIAARFLGRPPLQIELVDL